MEIVYQPSFQKAYEAIIRYIAQDHLINAQRFGNALLAQIDTLKGTSKNPTSTSSVRTEIVKKQQVTVRPEPVEG